MFKSFKIYNLLFLRLIIILAAIEITILVFKKELLFTAIFSLFIVFLLIREMYFYVKNFVLLYNKTIASIVQDDFSSDFSKHRFNKNYDDLFNLYDTLKTKQKEEVSRDIVYRSILNNIEMGIFILQKEGDDWNIFLMNDYFSRYFDVPKITKWKYLKNHLPALCNIIEEQGFQEVKTAIEIRVNQENVQTFVMQTSRTEICDLDYFIVLLDSIQNVVEKKRKKLG
ncbi:hypothetical protein [Flavobacterium sp. 140616W15]|uniref:hypothetical protein n=1 Tax=Flavobacterium sp. 140616W15 TaxID=2478552 RepID=UPI0026CC96A8